MSLSPVAIKEANDHISRLHLRVYELEEKCKNLTAELENRDRLAAEERTAIPEHLNQSLMDKDAEIMQLTDDLETCREVIRKLESVVEEKHAEIAEKNVEIEENNVLIRSLQERSRVLDQILVHKPTLEDVVTCLNVLQLEEEETLEEAIANYDEEAQETDLVGSPLKPEYVNDEIDRSDSGVLTSDTSVTQPSDIDSDLSLSSLGDPDTKRKILEHEHEVPSPEFV